MPDPLFFQLDDPTDPDDDTLYVEDDFAILRGITQGMLDWSNDITFAGTGAIPAASVFTNLVEGAANGRLSGSNPAATLAGVSGGLLRADGATTAGGYPTPILGNSFRLDTAARDALFTFWLDMQKSGWGASTTVGIAGAGTGAGASTQWALYALTNASGVITSLQFRMYGTSAPIDCVLLAGAALDLLFDGNPHQVGLHMKIEGGVGRGYIYCDGDLIVSGTNGAMTQFNQPNSGNYDVGLMSAPGAGGMVSNSTPAGTRLGRAAMYNLTGVTRYTVDDVLQVEAEGAEGFIT